MTYRQLIAIAFVMNGLTMLGMQAVGRIGSPGAIPVILLAMYGTGAVITLVQATMRRRPIEMKNVLIGIMGGLGTSIGVGLNVRAVQLLPGYIVFPLINGGIILIVVLLGRFVFKEKIGGFGIAGILAGIAAIILLSSK